MEAWMAITLFAGIILLIIIMIIVAVRRGRSYEQRALELGYSFAENDDELADQISGTLPMFSKGDPFCWYVVSWKNDVGDCYIFQYSYTHRDNYNKRLDREKVGMVFCVNSNNNLNELVNEDRKQEFSDAWIIEHQDSWLAMKRKDDDGERGINDKLLSRFHDEATSVLESIMKQ